MEDKIFFYNNSAIVWNYNQIPKDTSEFCNSNIFKIVFQKYIFYLKENDSILLNIFPNKLEHENSILKLFNFLNELKDNKLNHLIAKNAEFNFLKNNVYLFHQFIEEFYNFWRNHERYLICVSNDNKEYEKKPYTTFSNTINFINDLVRKIYRDICENITEKHPQIYRQVPAGFESALICKQQENNLSSEYLNVKKVPIITQVMLYPPLIIDPSMNKRTGQFAKVNFNPLKNINFNEGEWLTYPAKVGDLLIHVYFHNKFMNLGASLSNLFDIEDSTEKKPDAIFAFGIEDKIDYPKESKTIFYDDEKNNLLVGVVPSDDSFGYFGYLKKMMLTLHNVIMMKRNRLPVHGAMVKVILKNNKSANILLIGDTGAGKSESLEAFRILGKKYIKNMTIIFDDMGSLEIKNNELKAYGTEIGAFVRLDDLQPGFAFGNLDRSIIMSPHKINARAVLPITTIEEVLFGYKPDYVLYANNYEEIDENHELIDEFKNKNEALNVFKEGVVMSKGTTTTTGLVNTYFANIFGPPLYFDLHEKIANRFFDFFFDKNIFVGQIRTRLGIKGYESKGPEKAAEALFEMIMNK
jgi:hypothetical protein